MLVRLVVSEAEVVTPGHPRRTQQSTASAQVVAGVALALMRRPPELAALAELPTQHLLAVTMAVVRAELLPVEMEALADWSAASCLVALAEAQRPPQVPQEMAEMQPATALVAAAAVLPRTLAALQVLVATVRRAFAL